MFAHSTRLISVLEICEISGFNAVFWYEACPYRQAISLKFNQPRFLLIDRARGNYPVRIYLYLLILEGFWLGWHFQSSDDRKWLLKINEKLLLCFDSRNPTYPAFSQFRIVFLNVKTSKAFNL